MFFRIITGVIGRACFIGLWCAGTGVLCEAQKIKPRVNTANDWYKGAVTFHHQPEQQGYVLFDDSLRLFRFKPTLEADAKQIVLYRVASMTFYDTHQKKQRQFVSFEGVYGEGGPLFEILVGADAFVVLSQVHAFQDVLRKNWLVHIFYPLPEFNHVGYEQFEYIYVATADDSVQLILKVSHRFKRKFVYPFARPVKPVLHEEVLEALMAPHWQEVKLYIKTHRLKLTHRDDLIAVLTYYAENF